MQTSRSPLLLTNLLNDLESLCHLLVDRIGCGDTLNSYPLAAGAQQIIDRSGRMNAHMLRMAGGLIWRAAVARSRDWKAALWRLDVTALADELAMRVDGPWTGASVEPALREAAAALAGRLPALPRVLRHELLRLPACFRSFDQAPEDMVTRAQRFATQLPSDR